RGGGHVGRSGCENPLKKWLVAGGKWERGGRPFSVFTPPFLLSPFPLLPTSPPSSSPSPPKTPAPPAAPPDASRRPPPGWPRAPPPGGIPRGGPPAAPPTADGGVPGARRSLGRLDPPSRPSLRPPAPRARTAPLEPCAYS